MGDEDIYICQWKYRRKMKPDYNLAETYHNSILQFKLLT